MAAEKTFENKVKNYLKDQGCWFLKTWGGGFQRDGIPDILACCNGYFIGIELKAPKGKPSELQKWNIQNINKSRGIGIVLYPDQFDDFKYMIGCLKNGYDARANLTAININERWKSKE